MVAFDAALDEDPVAGEADGAEAALDEVVLEAPAGAFAADDVEDADDDVLDEEPCVELEATEAALLAADPVCFADWPQAARVMGRVRHAVTAATRRVVDDMRSTFLRVNTTVCRAGRVRAEARRHEDS